MGLRLSDFDAVTFDVYGTLIDWEPSITAFLSDWAARSGKRAAGGALLETYDRIRAEVQKERPAPLYPDVLRRSFDRMAAECGMAVEAGDREAFALSPHDWPAYPDSHAGLKALKARAKVGALSNIDEDSLRSSLRKLDFTFDLVVTAERVGAYKPDRPHFHTALAELKAAGIAPARVLHAAQSLRADIAPANKLGLKCAWINRPGRSLGLSGEGAAEAKPDLTVSSLAELVEKLTAGDHAAP